MSQGSLTINSVQLVNTAPNGWKALDLSPLWGAPNLRGSNVVIPGTAGQRAYPRRVDETIYRLPLVVFHTHSVGGTPYADPSNGLQTNVEYLYQQLVVASLASPVSSTLTWPSGTTKTASVQCQLSDPGQAGDHYGNTATKYTLYVTIPAGRFA